ncbi:MAG: NAD(P)H-dependent oxidoreductase [Burkholderiales bacterium]|nr:NAD(P)H-dependent oxidoreductase [Burkholderiales bacterium]
MVPDDVLEHMQVLTHERALVIQTTIWNEASYEAGLKAAMRLLIDEYALRYPGIRRVEHEYFHAVHGASDATRRAYLERADRFGREF